MTFKIFISSAIVSAFITAISNIIAMKISQRAAVKVAQEAANKEIEKMERTWQREDLVSSDDEFAEMAATVASFIYYENGTYCMESMQKIAAVRSKERGSIAKILDDLYESVRDNNPRAADILLTQAINEKRSIKSKSIISQ